jgi:hypothetical protein
MDKTTADKRKKQTVANSPFLAYVRRQYNGKILEKTRQLLNQEGPKAAVDFVCTFTREDQRQERMTQLAALLYVAPFE